jgi:hypothetical protein
MAGSAYLVRIGLLRQITDGDYDLVRHGLARPWRDPLHVAGQRQPLRAEQPRLIVHAVRTSEVEPIEISTAA